MPEGDTIFRTARTLSQVLAGRAVARFEATRLVERGPAPGTRVVEVEARGKHLLVHFDDGHVLHTHMLMTGSWHVYRVGEPWQRSRRSAVVVLETDDGMVAVCFAAPVVELLTSTRPARTPPAAGLDDLGPDLCRAGADLDDAVVRMRTLPGDTELGVALMTQRVACGVGNVFKSEVCFAARRDPSTPIAALDDGQRRAILAIAARQLRANLDTARRATVDGGLAVYGRAGRRCRRCGTVVRRRLQGAPARVTYWCPSCQPVAPDNASG